MRNREHRRRNLVWGVRLGSERDERDHRRHSMVWGVILMTTGLAFLLDRFGFLDLDSLWDYWPLLFVVIGIGRMAASPTVRGVLRGLGSIFFGVWLYAALNNLWGLTFMNSWPLLIIVWGLRIMAEGLFNRRDDKEPSHG
jgi:hypothetical protein